MRRSIIVLVLACGLTLSLAGAVAGATPPDLTIQWGGVSGDVPLVGDVDGDGKADLIIWRPGTLTFYVAKSSNGYDRNNPLVEQWGATGDTPLVGDIDGDGKADLIVYRPSNQTFYVLKSSNGFDRNNPLLITWAKLSGLTPTFRIADIDGDGKGDIAAFIPNRDGNGNSQWLALTSSTNYNPLFASYLDWGTQGDQPLLGRTFSTSQADIIAYRPSNGTWYPASSPYGFPIRRVMQWPYIVNGQQYGYAPDIIKEGTSLYAFACSDPINGGQDNIAVMKSTDAGKTWSSPTAVLWPANSGAVDPTIGNGTYPANGSFCDPSVVNWNGYYYLYNSNDFNAGGSTCPTGGWLTYVTVSRLPNTQPLDSPASAWATYTRDGTWVNEPSNPKAIILPKVIHSSPPCGYGAGEQSLIVVNNQLVMYYVDDSLNPVDFSLSIDNCWPIWRLTSSDGVTWATSQATQTNACGHSPVVRYDDGHSRYVLTRVDWAHTTNAQLVVQYSTDGINFTSPTVVIPSSLLPHYAHNLGVEGTDQGHFPSAETPLLSWAGPGDFRYDSNWNQPWDLYGGRFDILSGSPGSPSASYILGGSSSAVPLVGDVDGDGKDDLAIFDPNGTHSWNFAESTHGYSGAPNAVADFGGAGQTPFLAHFNPATLSGADLALYAASTGTWTIAYTANAVHAP